MARLRCVGGSSACSPPGGLRISSPTGATVPTRAATRSRSSVRRRRISFISQSGKPTPTYTFAWRTFMASTTGRSFGARFSATSRRNYQEHSSTRCAVCQTADTGRFLMRRQSVSEQKFLFCPGFIRPGSKSHMSWLKSLSANSRLHNVFQAFPETARPNHRGESFA
jgi:hypothetical protein